ncbi:MAG: OsmC family protein [Bacteroidota bacterium]|nr:OsmC family protein [Bacteroidota bacterium]
MATKTAFITQIIPGGITFSGKTDSGHWLTMDGPVEFGGRNAGIRPKELLLLAVAGCTGSDVASILAKKRVRLDGFEIHVTAEETEEHPKVFRSLHIEYVFYGKDIDSRAVERAIELSQTTYCGVSAMLRKAMEITHSYHLVPER